MTLNEFRIASEIRGEFKGLAYDRESGMWTSGETYTFTNKRMKQIIAARIGDRGYTNPTYRNIKGIMKIMKLGGCGC